jgi:hypothetical protein
MVFPVLSRKVWVDIAVASYHSGDHRSYVSVTVWERGRLGARETRQTARFQIRTAATRVGLENSPWSGPGGVSEVFRESGAEIGPVPAEHRRIQYKSTLISPNCANSPVLRRVEIGL